MLYQIFFERICVEIDSFKSHYAREVCQSSRSIGAGGGAFFEFDGFS